MANILKKHKAVRLRKIGKSISEISDKLAIPKSTVSIWCRDIKLGKKQIERLAKRQASGSYKGRITFLEKIRNRRLRETERLRREGLSDIKKLDSRDLFIAGIALYISEGATSDCTEEVSFTNSDFRTILFMKKWFTDICNVTPERFTIQVRINKIHKNRIKSIEKYWAKVTSISLEQFTKTILINSISQKVYPKNNSYYGTIRLKVKQGTQLRRKINGWVEGLLKIN
jgi:hypothetical protein